MNNFDQCYDENYEVIKTFVKRRVRNDADAEDITQDVFIVFHGKMGEARNATAYLYTIARCKVLDFFRKQKSRKDHISLTRLMRSRDDGHRQDFQPADPSAEIVDLDLDLSPEMKLRTEGYKFSEISEMLSIPEGTLRRRIHSERKTLKRKVYQCQ